MIDHVLLFYYKKQDSKSMVMLTKFVSFSFVLMQMFYEKICLFLLFHPRFKKIH